MERKKDETMATNLTEPITTSTTTSTSNPHFIELDETLNLISVSCNHNEDNEAIQTRHIQLRKIFNRYLEFPTLLDPHLDDILLRNTVNDDHDDDVDDDDDDDKIKKIHSPYQGLAIQCRDWMVELLFLNQKQKQEDFSTMTSFRLNECLTTIQSLCKVRGYKTIQRFLPHDPSDLEPVLHCLMRQNQGDGDSDGLLLLQWEGVQVLLLWLAMLLSNVPFDLDTILSCEDSVFSMVESVVRRYLQDAGPTRDAAAVCLASLLSRPDASSMVCNNYLHWALDVMRNKEFCGMGGIYLKMGVVQTLATLFKMAPRTKLLLESAREMESLWQTLIEILEDAKDMYMPPMILRKMLIKLFARVGCAYLPPRVASWRYERGKRSLFSCVESASEPNLKHACATSHNITSEEHSSNLIRDEIEDVVEMLLRGLRDDATVVRWSSAKGIGRITERLPEDCADDVVEAVVDLCNERESDCAWHGSCLALAELSRRGLLLPQRLSLVVPVVVKAMQYDVKKGQHSVGAHVRDAACYTSWAFARAYAPSILRNYVNELSREIVLTCLFDREVNCRRAASAAFQECVGRQGADNFVHGIDILTKADYFSLGNLTESYTKVASFVARFEEYRPFIIERLWKVKLRHWDIDIRQLTAKSLAMMTLIDPQYVTKNILQVLTNRCTHKDILIRHGAILGVAEIILSLANLSDGENLAGISSLIVNIVGIVHAVEKGRLYRGRGGENIRIAISRLIECISVAKLPLQVKLQVKYLDSIDSSLRHPKEEVQKGAAAALFAFTRSYFPVGKEGPSDRLQARVVDKYINDSLNDVNPAITRGSTLGLGQLPRKLVACKKSVLDKVINCLIHMSCRNHRVGKEGDAETRRNAINSLVQICVDVGVRERGVRHDKFPSVCVDKGQLSSIFRALFAATDDYCIDRRGDVGSWCRMAAIEGLQKVTFHAVDSSYAIPKTLVAEKSAGSSCAIMPKFGSSSCFFEKNAQDRAKSLLACKTDSGFDKSFDMKIDTFFDENICKRIICLLLKQLCEKLDVVRSKAGLVLENLLCSTSPRIPHIPFRSSLMDALGLIDVSPSISHKLFYKKNSGINWANPALTYPLVTNVVSIPVYFDCIISGLVISVGGITESVVKNSSAALLSWTKLLQNSAKVKLWNMLLSLFIDHHKDERVILPLLKTMDLLMTHRCFDFLHEKRNAVYTRDLVTLLDEEAVRCSDVKRLFAIIDILLIMISTCDVQTSQMTVIPVVLKFLCHRYPRIRRFCAENFYAKLQEVDWDEKAGLISDILLTVTWDTNAATELEKSIARIASIINVAIPKQRIYLATTQKREKRNEFDCYSSLVKEAGR